MKVQRLRACAPDGVDSWPRQGMLVLGIFLTAQVFDGALTYWGVTQLAITLEANPLIVTGIHAIGAGPAVIVAKLLASVCGYILYRTEALRLLAVAAGLYIGVAVVPWLLIASSLSRP